MLRMRRVVAGTTAVLLWGAGGFFVVAGLMGADLSRLCSRVCNFCLMGGTTLAVYVFVSRFVCAPRAAYRLGWEARGRHDRGPEAEVVDMSERRRARL